ncbi:hypothetical protein FH972_021434 [Carpinus fangiana]|uniref:SET domain-containing protein n=1 Tax=Carpinus fangiana TaxID=176857 RepID=A0A5N6KPY9_9ROSI|nr:hypothetical protein FH972_021434 [Carpinus fangiana]
MSSKIIIDLTLSDDGPIGLAKSSLKHLIPYEGDAGAAPRVTPKTGAPSPQEDVTGAFVWRPSISPNLRTHSSSPAYKHEPVDVRRPSEAGSRDCSTLHSTEQTSSLDPTMPSRGQQRSLAPARKSVPHRPAKNLLKSHLASRVPHKTGPIPNVAATDSSLSDGSDQALGRSSVRRSARQFPDQESPQNGSKQATKLPPLARQGSAASLAPPESAASAHQTRSTQKRSESVDPAPSPRSPKRHRPSPQHVPQDEASTKGRRKQKLEDMPAFQKATAILLHHLERYNTQVEQESSKLLAAAKAVTPPPSTRAYPTSSSTNLQSKDGMWIFESGVQRIGKAFAVRRLPAPGKNTRDIWKAVFTSRKSASNFLAKCLVVKGTSCSDLERLARQIILDNEGQVSFQFDRHCIETEKASCFESLKSKDTARTSASSQNTQSFQLSHETWALPQEIIAKRPDVQKHHATTTAAQVASFCSESKAVPPYRWHRPIRLNVLAQNNKRLLVWPLPDNVDDAQQELMENELIERFNRINPESRSSTNKPIFDIESRHFRKSVIEPYLKHSLACQVQNKLSPSQLLLHYFLNSTTSLSDHLAPEVQALWKQRDDFDRNQESWVRIVSSLPEVSSAQLAAAAIVCRAFEHILQLSLWHYVKPMANDIYASLTLEENKDETLIDSICRICLLRNCLYHGTISEGDDSDDDQPDVVNTKRHVLGRPRPSLAKPADKGMAMRPKKKYITIDRPETDTFLPCSHPGPCEGNRNCDCFKNHRPCEKSCHCDVQCDRRFPGCSCATGGKPCSTEDCLCWATDRECDADICGKCGAVDMLDPESLGNRGAVIDQRKCGNVAIQRNIPKRLLTGQSAIRGFGLFVGEVAYKGDFLGEYRGEIVGKSESGRRGVEYHYQTAEYLWDLDKQQELDATNFGGKFRYPNHSGDAATINMSAKIKLCNGVWRVGLWATRTIRPGEEIFFDYGYPLIHTEGFWEPGKDPGSSNLAAKKSKVKVVRSTKPSIAKNKLRGILEAPSVGVNDLQRSNSNTTDASDDEDMGVYAASIRSEEYAHVTSGESAVDTDAERRTRVDARRRRKAGARPSSGEVPGASSAGDAGDDGDDDDTDAEINLHRPTRIAASRSRPKKYTR